MDSKFELLEKPIKGVITGEAKVLNHDCSETTQIIFKESCIKVRCRISGERSIPFFDGPAFVRGVNFISLMPLDAGKDIFFCLESSQTQEILESSVNKFI